MSARERFGGGTIGQGACKTCGIEAERRSWDRLCLDCVTEDRDIHRENYEGANIEAREATAAFAGLANEPLTPCVDTCVGHFGPLANALYHRGLARFHACADRSAK